MFAAVQQNYQFTRHSRQVDRPQYHVVPRVGWLNDPNGPIYYKGKYHLFYQHLANSCEWDFGIVWGHAVSSNLVDWEHLPVALVPTPGSADADGCFSGCAVVDTDGTPTILYTGVRLRSNPECGDLPPPECDLNLPFIESQCVAVADPSDDALKHWAKESEPLIELPPADLPLTGWRDPFVFQRGGRGQEWAMLIGCGLKGKGGSAMVYKSDNLRCGWKFTGMLCEAETTETGAMWECPLIAKLDTVATPSTPSFRSRAFFSGASAFDAYKLDSMIDTAVSLDNELPELHDLSVKVSEDLSQRSEHNNHLFCVSPDAPTNPVLYWLGTFDEEDCRFRLEEADGPYRLDLGDILYAPNIMQDAQGQNILWGWLQERRRPGTYEYSGCLSLPRLLYVRNGKLVQEPAPQVALLRRGDSWRAQALQVFPEEAIPLPVVGGHALDIEVTFERGTATAVGLYFQSWNADGVGSAAVVYDWLKGTLEVAFTNPAAGDVEHAPEINMEQDALRRVGGPVDIKPGEPVSLRVLLDHSCVEIYCSSGEVLSTRVYRGRPPAGGNAGVDLIAYGGTAVVERVAAWEMGSSFSELYPGHGHDKVGLPLAMSPAASLESELAVII